MPTSRERKRHDGSVARFPATPGRIDSRPPPEGSDLAPAKTVVRPGTLQSAHEDTVFWLVNEVRSKAGLSRLRRDERLRTAARNHSKDMARRKFCAHVNPDGVTPAQRMSDAGYPHPGAENVARGQQKPHSVMTAWMQSPGHRANILNPGFATIGVGVELAWDGPFWTQNFGY